jgi:CHAT domain-containing protein
MGFRYFLESTDMRHYFIRHAFTAAACSLLFGLTFMLAANPARAQSEADQTEESFKKLSDEDIAKYRAVLAEPIKKDVTTINLEAQLFDKYHAARALGDEAVLLAFLREAVTLTKDTRLTTHYITSLQRRGDFEEALKVRHGTVNNAENAIGRALYSVFLAEDYFTLFRVDLAREWLTKAQSILTSGMPARLNTQAQGVVARATSRAHALRARMASSAGKHDIAIQAITEAIQASRKEVEILKNAGDLQRTNSVQGLVYTLGLRVSILTAAQRPEINDAMRDFTRVMQENTVSPFFHARALIGIGRVRFAQREFAQSSQIVSQSLNKFEQQNIDATSPVASNARTVLATALIGQQKYPEALAEFNKLDALAGNDKTLQERVRYPFDRATVYLYNNKPQEAAPLLASAAVGMAKQYGVHPAGTQHFFTAQANGLQGVALWRVGTAESKVQAYELLQAAVQAIMSPENSDYLESSGIRKELREMIFSTYIEAAAQTSAADALVALGIADWMRGGSVQEALGDAAVRAAASNDTLSNFVRQDQDARNEIKGLRNFLSGDAGESNTTLPQIAAQMRERISLLEKTRADVQVKIKAAFPDYEKLVRPSPPTIATIQANLKVDEALVVLQPTDNAVYVWAIPKDGAGVFNRASLTNAQLAALVKRLRGSLDVAGVDPKRRPAFDHSAAQEIYSLLLSPVQQGLAGKTNLVIAAGGVLGQIPFGVLETAAVPRTVTMQDAPWLIKQAAITHVPSVSAWLSMRALPHKAAAQPMLAWGDPLFNLALANTGKSSSGEVRKVVLTRASTSVDLEKEDSRNAIKYADIPALPETRDELSAIAKTLGADIGKDLILGSAATRESVLAENKNGNLIKQRVVAFATHGLMAGDLPNLMQPALAMAGTKDDASNVLAPLLTLEDVLTLKLNADWVVLSACNTAAADGKAEEALSGLARGFFYAGSRSLLVTHWAVDSESAVTLTTETFKNYQSKPQEAKAESLRQAMLLVMNNPATAHPTYWAPYALVGDGAR